MTIPAGDDLLAALALVQSVQSAPSLADYRVRVLDIRRLVACDAIGYNEVSIADGSIYTVLDPMDAAFEGVEAAFAQFADQHPVIEHHARTGDPSPRAISDFLSREAFHALDLYRTVYGPMGVEDQLSFALPSPPGSVVGVALNRSSRGFAPTERELIALIQPHMGQAFLDARMHEAMNPLDRARLQRMGLSRREAEVTAHLVEGCSAQQIADALEISVHTARHHVANIYTTLAVQNRAALVATVLRGEARPTED